MTVGIKSLIIFTFLALSFQSHGQSEVDVQDFERHVRFLSSDALQGRKTGTFGNDVAATYIAEELRSYGVQLAPGLKSYFQPVDLIKVKPSNQGRLQIKDVNYEIGENLLFVKGRIAQTSADVVYAGHGWIEGDRDDYGKLDVEGKIVLVEPGITAGESPQILFSYSGKKRKIAEEKGAIALIELYKMQFPWKIFKSVFSREQLQLKGNSNEALVYGWLLTNFDDAFEKLIKKKRKGSIYSEGESIVPVLSNNVIGLIEGSDELLAQEYVVMSAHFDHVGMKEDGEGDRIFNGARDNAIGTASVLVSAKQLVKDRPKRSVIIAAVTAEEVGLLGSRYYADNPVVPLNKTIFNLNSDGAGYNDTTSLAIIGYGRVGIDQEINAAAEEHGLKVLANPMPEQNLYDRSDNVNFAAKGVPAINISPGLSAFDDSVTQYYHQVADEADSLNFRYLSRYVQAYYSLAWRILNKAEKPSWIKGDKYENAGTRLYKAE